MLEWNVYTEDFNNKKIRIFNVFNHHYFIEDLVKIKKKCKEKEEFAKAVKSSLTYYYRSKCEWEIILSDWPPSKEEYDFKEEKVDVYDQVMLNWDKFISYLWENKKEIKLKK